MTHPVYEEGDLVERVQGAYVGARAIVELAAAGTIKIRFISGPKVGHPYESDPRFIKLVSRDINIDA